MALYQKKALHHLLMLNLGSLDMLLLLGICPIIHTFVRMGGLFEAV